MRGSGGSAQRRRCPHHSTRRPPTCTDGNCAKSRHPHVLYAVHRHRHHPHEIVANEIAAQLPQRDAAADDCIGQRYDTGEGDGGEQRDEKDGDHLFWTFRLPQVC
jgi:hypothetical protein